jgi:HEAT repeat protein
MPLSPSGSAPDASVEERIRRLLTPSDDRHWRDEVRGLDASAALPVLTRLLSDMSLEWMSRRLAALAIGVMGDPRGTAALVAAVADPNEFVRAEAVQSLALLGSTERQVDEGIARALADPSDLVRKMAARSAGSLRLSNAVDRLRQMAATDPVAGVAAHARQALAEMEASG